MIASEVIRQARVNMMRDVDADDFAFPDKMIIDGINHTIQRALKLKPILAWTDTHTYSAPSYFRFATAEDEIRLPDEYGEAIVAGTCAYLCSNVDADTPLLQAQQRYEATFIQLMRL